MAAVNYTIIPLQFPTVTVGQTAGSQDLVFISMKIQPIFGYYAEHWMFSISGASPNQAESQLVENSSVYVNGDTGVNLPSWITKVVFVDSSGGGFQIGGPGVNVNAYVDPNWVITSGADLNPFSDSVSGSGDSNLVTILDIDGDAQEIPPAPPVGFSVTCEMAEGTASGCTVSANISPTSVDYPTVGTYFGMGGIGSSQDCYRLDTQNEFSLSSQNLNSAFEGQGTTSCTMNMIMGSSVVDASAASISALHMSSSDPDYWYLFKISPQPGYKLSRHNLRIRVGICGYYGFSDGEPCSPPCEDQCADDLDPVYGFYNGNEGIWMGNYWDMVSGHNGVQVEIGPLDPSSGINSTSDTTQFHGTIYGGEWTSSIEPNIPTGPNGPVWQLTFPDEYFANTTGGGIINQYQDQVLGAANPYVNYQYVNMGNYGNNFVGSEFWFDTELPIFTIFNQSQPTHMCLLDTIPIQGQNGIFPNSGSLANSGTLVGFGNSFSNYENNTLPSPFGFGFVDGVQPDWICPSDFNSNEVVVGIKGFGNIIPGEMPPDIKFLIHGSAMADDGSICVDGGFSGEES